MTIDKALEVANDPRIDAPKCRACLVLAGEVERLNMELLDTQNAIRLICGRDQNVPWPEISADDVESYVAFIRAQRIAAEAAKGDE